MARQARGLAALLGFGAVLLTFFGNLFFGGLHSYGGWSSGLKPDIPLEGRQ